MRITQVGKATGQPVYNLLGGRTRECIRAYASRLYATEDLDVLAAEAQAFLDQGFTAMKQCFGYGPRDGVRGMRRNLELVQTVREVIGPDVELAADAYMGWDVRYAIRMIHTLEDAGMPLAWVEEPVMPHAGQMHNYHLIMAHMNSPIAEFFPPPVGFADGNELFWTAFVGEPLPHGGYITLPDRPGLGLELNWETIGAARITAES